MTATLRKYGSIYKRKKTTPFQERLRQTSATEEPHGRDRRSGQEDVTRLSPPHRPHSRSGRKVPVSERLKITRKVADGLKREREKLALTNTLETGKPIRESRLVETAGAIRTLEYYAGAGAP
ncbi:MAG: aldehyde dehydrogenase family protein [Thermodesulfobacteriota bacterium]